MFSVVFNLFLIQAIVVSLVDLSGFVDTVKHWVYKWLWPNRPYRDFDFKPWSCDYCMTHHIGLLYLLIVGKWSLLAYAILLALCFFAPLLKDIFIFVKDLITKLLDLLYTLFKL